MRFGKTSAKPSGWSWSILDVCSSLAQPSVVRCVMRGSPWCWRALLMFFPKKGRPSPRIVMWAMSWIPTCIQILRPAYFATVHGSEHDFTHVDVVELEREAETKKKRGATNKKIVRCHFCQLLAETGPCKLESQEKSDEKSSLTKLLIRWGLDWTPDFSPFAVMLLFSRFFFCYLFCWEFFLLRPVFFWPCKSCFPKCETPTEPQAMRFWCRNASRKLTSKRWLTNLDFKMEAEASFFSLPRCSFGQ